MSLSPKTDAALKTIKTKCPSKIVNLCKSLERECSRKQRVIDNLASSIIFSSNFFEDTDDQKTSQRKEAV
jgi:hypothetical protein